jgi:hypothetical protein
VRERVRDIFSIWQFHFDITLLWVLLFIVGTVGEGGTVKPEVWSYLGDKYCRFAELYKKCQSVQYAAACRRKAEHFLRIGGPGEDDPSHDPPPGAALAMPIPEPPVFTRAIGFWWPQKRGAVADRSA